MAFIYDLTDTWNAGGTTFNAIKMNVTDTASAAASKLVTLQVGGSERFGVDKTGIASFAGAVRGPLGSVSAPAFSFTSDTNTGMWSPAADTLAFSTAGSERVRVDSSGNVGIGLSAPNVKLHVMTGSNYAASFNTSTTTASSTAITIGGFSNGTAGAGGNVAIRGYHNHSATTASSMAFEVNGATEVMRIDSSGNVGIGTSSPSQRLHVATTAAPSGTTQSFLRATADVGFGADFGGGIIQGVGPIATISTVSSGTATERMRIDSSGNVGIGTSSPGTYNGLLNVKASDRSVIGYFGGTTYAVRLGANSSFGTVEAVDAATGVSSYQPLQIGGSILRFDTGGSERMRIDSSGNVGIGNSAPSATLTLQAANNFPFINWNNSSNTQIAFAGWHGGSGGGGDFRMGTVSTTAFAFQTNNTERARIDSSGNLLVGTTTANAKLSVVSSAFNGLYVDAQGAASNALFEKNNTAGGYAVFNYSGSGVGSITTNGTSTSYNTSSDARRKHDIVDAPDAADLIDAIKVRSFKWNADNSEQRYGMIAQELLEVAPEAVSVPADEDQMMGVDYSKLVPMLIKEVQSLRARVAQLEGN